MLILTCLLPSLKRESISRVEATAKVPYMNQKKWDAYRTAQGLQRYDLGYMAISDDPEAAPYAAQASTYRIAMYNIITTHWDLPNKPLPTRWKDVDHDYKVALWGTLCTGFPEFTLCNINWKVHLFTANNYYNVRKAIENRDESILHIDDYGPESESSSRASSRRRGSLARDSLPVRSSPSTRSFLSNTVYSASSISLPTVLSASSIGLPLPDMLTPLTIAQNPL